MKFREEVSIVWTDAKKLLWLGVVIAAIVFVPGITPTSVPWWGWLLIAVALYLVLQFVDDEKYFFRWRLLAIVFFLVVLLGLVRFVKWAWNS